MMWCFMYKQTRNWKKIFRSMLAAFNFINFPLVSTLINFCGKAFSLLAFMAKVINKSNRDQNGWEKLPYAHTKAYLQSNAKKDFCMDIWHFYWPFWAKVTNSESFGHFGYSYLYWPLWPWILMVKVMWFGACLWATSGIHFVNKSLYSGRHLLPWDWKYEYIHTSIGN